MPELLDKMFGGIWYMKNLYFFGIERQHFFIYYINNINFKDKIGKKIYEIKSIQKNIKIKKKNLCVVCFLNNVKI